MPETLEMCYDPTRAERDMVDGDLATRPDATEGARHRDFFAAQGQRCRNATKQRRSHSWTGSSWWILLGCILCWISPAYAALVDFSNCLSKETLENPLALQFVPLEVGVWFNLTDPLRPLNVTVYGNVSGTADESKDYPSPNDPNWKNDNSTVGKIVNLDKENNHWTTLLTDFDVLSFEPWKNGTQFCDTLVQGHCPLAPVFNGNL